MVLQLDPNLDLKSVTYVRAHLLPMSPAFTMDTAPEAAFIVMPLLSVIVCPAVPSV